MLEQLEQRIAKKIIETVGATGTPPDYGFQFFTAGLDAYLGILKDEYLSTYIPSGGSAFKLVVGAYGGGKTHFLYCLRQLAWEQELAVAYVSLKAGESPFHRLDLVYRAIVQGLVPPLTPGELLSGYERGIASFLKRLTQGENGSTGVLDTRNPEASLLEIDSISFKNAIVAAFRTLHEGRMAVFDAVCQWLTVEGFNPRMHRPLGILQRIDRTTAFSMIRSLTQFVRAAGFRGLVVLFDEAERVPSLTRAQKEQHLGNLRELIDECGQTNLQGLMVFYAVPDEAFLEGRTQIYEALKQRLATVFELPNPTGIKIELDKITDEPVQLLHDIGGKLAAVYERAYGPSLGQSVATDIIRRIADAAYAERYADAGYKRLFVQRLIRELNAIRLSSG